MNNAFWVRLSYMPFLARSAQLSLTLKPFEQMTFFERSWRSQKSNTARLQSSRLEIRASASATAPMLTQLRPGLFFRDRWTDKVFFLVGLNEKSTIRGRCAPPEHECVQAKDKSELRLLFGAIFAIFVSSFRKFGRVCMDAMPNLRISTQRVGFYLPVPQILQGDKLFMHFPHLSLHHGTSFCFLSMQ
jgi:hypothetical protein